LELEYNKKPEIKEFLNKILNFLQFEYFIGKNQKGFWNDIGKRLFVKEKLIQELIFLTTVFFNSERMDF